ncbi:MAG: apolipoprotein N-acyltransferase [Paracoccaceae bacterium]
MTDTGIGAPTRYRLLHLLLPVLLGAIAALGLAPFDQWWTIFPALAGVGWLFLGAGTTRAAAWVGWRFGLGYFAVGLMWIVEPFLVDVPRHGWMAPFALVFMAGGLALFWGAAFWVAARLGGSPARRITSLIVTIALAEFARAYVLTGFPWAGLAQIWVETEAALLLAWIGPHGLGAGTLAAALPLALLIGAGRARWLALGPVTMLALAVLAVSAQRQAPVMTGQTVRVIQPNAAQHLKWHPDHVWQFFDRQLALTAGYDPEARPDLIVWPESSIPPYLHNAGLQVEQIAEAARGVPVVAGIRRADGLRAYNSLILIGETGQVDGLYDKHHLVPFGEYMPLDDLAGRFGIHGLAAEDGSGYSAGPSAMALQIPGIGQAVPLICYEAVFPQDVAAAPGRSDLLLQITNDAWFGNWSGPYQHLAQARMRAIEQGLPMIRSANTGVSAVIGPQGTAIADLPLNTAGALDAPLPAPMPPTLYSRSGDWPVFLILLVILGVLIGRHMSRAGSNGD